MTISLSENILLMIQSRFSQKKQKIVISKPNRYFVTVTTVYTFHQVDPSVRDAHIYIYLYIYLSDERYIPGVEMKTI